MRLEGLSGIVVPIIHLLMFPAAASESHVATSEPPVRLSRSAEEQPRVLMKREAGQPPLPFARPPTAPHPRHMPRPRPERLSTLPGGDGQRVPGGGSPFWCVRGSYSSKRGT